MTTPCRQTPSTPPPLTVRRVEGRGLVLALGLGAVVVSMMQTLVVPVLGTIQRDLRAPAADASWLTTATLLSAAVCTPLLSRMGDRYGRRPVLIGVMAVTAAGSLLAALAEDLPLLIVGRFLQGVSTAVFPLAQAVLRAELPAQRLPAAMGTLSGGLALGTGSALVGAALLTRGDTPDFHGVFRLATAVSVLSLVAIVAYVPPSRSASGAGTDWRGAAGLTLTLLLLLLPLSRGGVWGWTSGWTLGCLAACGVAATIWARGERSVPHPLIDMDVLVHRPVLLAHLAGLLLGFAMFSQFILVSALVQVPPSAGYGFGASVLDASVRYLLPSSLASLAAAQVAGPLMRRGGPRPTLAIGSVTGALGFALLAGCHGSSAAVQVSGVLVGVAIAFGFAALPAALMALVPPAHTAVANGVNSVARSVGSAVAGALVAVLVAAGEQGRPPAESRFTACFALAGAALLLIAVLAGPGMAPAPADRRRATPRDP
ncbi:MFS transporter [Streptomyces sp. NPDC089424]|uniref:MFS transporter n=1 Tax=Streptomyces sp. NPDC089424 TaxID=3365917 RepID=UPI00381BAA6C